MYNTVLRFTNNSVLKLNYIKANIFLFILSRNADCVVRIDHDEFHCHLLVLQSYSTFFDEKNCKDIDLSGVRYIINCTWIDIKIMSIIVK